MAIDLCLQRASASERPDHCKGLAAPDPWDKTVVCANLTGELQCLADSDGPLGQNQMQCLPWLPS